MAGSGRLCIYDSADNGSVRIARGRDALYRLGADSSKALQNGLDQLVAGGHRFSRVVFDTHGSGGEIYFGGETIDAGEFKKNFKGKNYHTLFPNFSRMYFSGCNISDDETGWAFLEAANSIFFVVGGGVSFAYTSVGFAPRWYFEWTPKHLWGDIRYVIRDPGKAVRRYDGANLMSDFMSGRMDVATWKIISGE